MGEYDWVGDGSVSPITGMLKEGRAAEGALALGKLGYCRPRSEWKRCRVRRPLATAINLQFESVTSNRR
jgi:hypothetical protein